MSRFFSERYRELVPYTPGEQPQDRSYLKLNTNESPFPPAPGVASAVREEAGRLQLYSDPDCKALTACLAETYGVRPEQIVVTNGSDEALDFAFKAFADEARPLVFADITYGFYPVFAEINHIPYTEIPLRDDFSLDVRDYTGFETPRTIVLANPNAPSGRALPLSDIERVAEANRNGIVIVDEAYVDFGAESAVRLTDRYENLLVVQTFSKSRSLAGARLGFAIGDAALIADLHTIRYSTNPYNVNRMTAAAGLAALSDGTYYRENCGIIRENRAWTAEALTALGFTVLPSQANFLFVRSPKIGGQALYGELKKRGVLIRHFTKERIADYNRITIGTKEQMKRLVDAIEEILEEQA